MTRHVLQEQAGSCCLQHVAPRHSSLRCTSPHRAAVHLLLPPRPPHQGRPEPAPPASKFISCRDQQHDVAPNKPLRRHAKHDICLLGAAGKDCLTLPRSPHVQQPSDCKVSAAQEARSQMWCRCGRSPRPPPRCRRLRCRGRPGLPTSPPSQQPVNMMASGVHGSPPY